VIRNGKASFARTNRRQGLSGLGRIFGWALSAPAAVNDADGSGAPSAGRRGPVRRGPIAALLLFAVLAVAFVFGVIPAIADEAPQVTNPSAPFASRTEHTAILRAEVNPGEGPSETEWHFEISSVGSEGPWEVVPGGGSLTADNEFHEVESEATGLIGNTRYWIKIVAENEAGGNTTESSGNQSFPTAGPQVRFNVTASNITDTSALLEGEVNPGEPPEEAEWHFEISSVGNEGPWEVVPGGGSLPSDETYHEVDSEATGLTGETQYWFRLIVEKTESEPDVSAVRTFSTAGPPKDATTSPTFGPNGAAWHVSGSVNPNGGETDFFFEYGPDTSYGNTAPVPPGDAGSGYASVPVGADLFGLTPGATYHFRLVAENAYGEAFGEDQTLVVPVPPEGGPTSCPNEAFRTGYGANLPDCRAYEMASAVDKEGQSVGEVLLGAVNPTAAANGEATSYQTGYTFNESEPTGNPASADFMARRGASGWSTRAIDPPLGPVTPEVGFGLVAPKTFTPNLGGFVIEGAKTSVLYPASEESTKHLFYRNDATNSFELLTGVPPETGFGLGAGPVAYQTLTPDGSRVLVRSEYNLATQEPGDYFYDWNPGTGTVTLLAEGAKVARNGGNSSQTHNAWHVISADGSRIFIEGGPIGCGVCVLVNGSPQEIGGTFWLANSNGTVAYVTEGGELQRYNVNASSLTNLTEPEGGGNGQVQGVLGASADGSRVYFVANAALTPGASAGRHNLYLWTDDGTPTGRITFIATGENANSFTNNYQRGNPTSRVSPNGMHVAFNSQESLTGYDNANKTEIYTYNAGDGVLSCASCNPSGEPATTNTQIPGSLGADLQSRVLLDSGQVFFTSDEALVAGDVNGSTADAYEYDSTSDELSLLSTGTSSHDSEFTDAGASGRDVFFTTSQQLVGVDKDELIDVYDARVNGGLGAQHPAPPEPPCTGEGCHPEASAPDLVPPASAAVVGKGNLPSTRDCGKLGREAKKLSNRAKKLRRHAKQAKRSGKSKVAKKRNRKATRLAKRARHKSKGAKKCRKANRRASK
jgi:hypothetical protein